MRRIIGLIFVSLFLIACSSRIEHTSVLEQTSPDAIDLNSAPVEQLEGLPHIGRKTAESIVAFREQNGPFRRVEHLLLIRGVSEERFKELRPLVRVN